MSDPVAAQYEALPYPPRDPADEKKRLITGSPSHLLEIEHFVFGGRRAGPIRALVAGGGTGDGAIMLAQQLEHRGEGGEVVHLDLSAASQAVARARAEVRGLNNISFAQASLLDAPKLGLGRFDYVDCCGVPHHLEEPAAGLAALRDVLTGDGGMGLMLYGALGRTGVYPLQSALRRLAGDAPVGQKLTLARRLLAELPESNWFRRNPHLSDHARGEPELYDLLLHARDRAYTVPEIAALVEDAGLRLAGFTPGWRYDPARLLGKELAARTTRLPDSERWALAEELAGDLKTHVFYVAAGEARADPTRAEAVPCLRETDPIALAAALRRSRRLKLDLQGRTERVELPEGSAELVALIDGRRSLRQLHAELARRRHGLDWLVFSSLFASLWAALHPLNLLLLGGPGASPRAQASTSPA
jgi:SAM-dependent methyltransferase